MAENIDAKNNWRSLALAFIAWAAHFMMVYAAALILPEHPAVRWIALAAALIVLGALIWWWRKMDERSMIAKLSLSFAAAAIIAQTLPALLG